MRVFRAFARRDRRAYERSVFCTTLSSCHLLDRDGWRRPINGHQGLHHGELCGMVDPVPFWRWSVRYRVAHCVGNLFAIWAKRGPEGVVRVFHVAWFQKFDAFAP